MAEHDGAGGALPFDAVPGFETIFPDSGQFEAVERALPEEENDHFPEIIERSAAGGPELESVDRVAWPESDRQAPDYAHLIIGGGAKIDVGPGFDFDKAAMELIIAANRYQPVGHEGIIAFGMRGAKLRGAEKVEQVDHVSLEDARPDHRHFRCVIGFYFRATGRFSAFTASTVPWHEYMSNGVKNNLLPTACYIYKKGKHAPANQAHWVEPAFRLSDKDGAITGRATVLRTKRDNIFDITDEWDMCEPSDNIHCAYSNETFSSLGCQTVKGKMDEGLWPLFQATIRSLPNGARTDYVLMTGAEAGIAAALVKAGKSMGDAEVHTRLGRLRVGSYGEDVKRLQTALGMVASGYFGPETKKKLAAAQSARHVPADGVWAPASDTAFGWTVFAAPAASATATPAPAVATPATPVPEAVVPAPPATPVPVAPMVAAATAAAAATATAPASADVGSATRTAETIRLVRATIEKIAPRPKPAGEAAIWDHYVTALTSKEGADVLAHYGLADNKQRLVFILANMCAETGGLSLIWESMKYRADRIVEIFGDAAHIDHAEAAKLAGNEQALAERVYGLGRPAKAKELGNSQPGDGFRYRGGGFLQTTGRDNYAKLGKLIGADLENHPDLIADPIISLKAACAEWNRAKLNAYADDGSFRACCNGINYGNPTVAKKPIGFNDRVKYLQACLKAFDIPKVNRKPGSLEALPDPLFFELGDIDPAIGELQRRLQALGYEPGAIDDCFTTHTRDALLSFQANNGLDLSGMSDSETRAALDRPDAVRAEPSSRSMSAHHPASTPETVPVAAGTSKPSAPAQNAPMLPAPAPGRAFAWLWLLISVVGLAAAVAASGVRLGLLAAPLPLQRLAVDAVPAMLIGGWLVAVMIAIGNLSRRRSRR